MAVQTTSIIKPLNDQLLEITVSALNGVPLTGATVSVSLVTEFGIPVSGIQNITLTDVTGSVGSYSATLLGSAFNALAGNYTLKVTYSLNGAHFYTEQPVTIQFSQASSNLMVGALCSVPALKAWAKLNPNTTTGVTTDMLDVLYAQVINRFTEYAANSCNRPSFLVSTYTETRNGNGKGFIKPKFAFSTNEIQTVTSVVVDGLSIPAAPSVVTSGFVHDDYLVYLRNREFSRGIQNVTITYTAGLPSIPLELEQAALDACSFWLKKREYIGQNSLSLSGQTVTYDSSDVLKTTCNVLANYTRRH